LVNFVLNIFAVRANSKFQFVRAAVSKNSFLNSYYKINLRESLKVNCFVNFYMPESVNLRFRVQTTEHSSYSTKLFRTFFYISCDVY